MMCLNRFERTRGQFQFVIFMQALKEEGRVGEAAVAFRKTLSLDEGASPSLHVYRTMATMRQQMGEHAEAVRILDTALGFGKDEQVRTPGLLGVRIRIDDACHAPFRPHPSPYK